jgi:hypothetical protein
MNEEKRLKVNPEECDRDIRTYGDVIRHMTNQELALFLQNGQFEVELGLLAVIRAKTFPHRHGERMLDTKEWGSMYGFMEHRVSDEEWNYGDVWGIENWQDMVQWEWPGKKNFGMDVVY